MIPVRATDGTYQLTKNTWYSTSLALRSVLLCRVGSVGKLESKKSLLRTLPGVDAFIKKCDKGFRIDNALPHESEAQGRSQEQHRATTDKPCLF